MNFANPLLLSGTALVALPIVLHLIMRRKPKRLEFPALRFLRMRRDVNQRRLRLRHLLLLLLRAAIIACLAFALARPSMKIKFSGPWGSQEAPVAAALIIDTAPRMQYRQDNRTRLDVAREIAAKLLVQLPRDSKIAVLDSSLGPAAFQVDRGSAKERIERLESVANSQPLTRAIDAALELLEPSKLPRKEIYVFTDLAAAAWPPGAAAHLQDRLTNVPGVGVYLIDVGVDKPVNFALGELRLSAEVLSNRSTLQIETELSQTGPGGDRTVEMYLLDENRKPQKRSEQPFTLKPGQPQHVEFKVGSLEVGTHQGYVRIVGQDGLEADDTRYFTVEVRPAWPVLLAAPPSAAAHALFLNQALAPTAFRQQGRARFECDVLPLDQLPQRPLSSYAVVCLLDPGPLEPAVWRKLVNFASEGHGVAVFLGRNAEPLSAFNDPAAQELLPGKLLRQARRPNGSLHLAPHDYQHPVLSVLKDQAGTVPWDDFPVYRYWQLGALAPGVSVVVPYSDDGPAVLERPVGAGKVLTMTTPVSDRPNRDPWNLLPAGEAWPFVILVNQMMLYLAGGADQQLNYYAGETALLHLDRQSPHTPYIVTTPQEMTFPLSPDAEHNTLTITGTDRAGNYRVQAGGQQGGVDRGFSVNLAPGQTQMERLPRDKLSKLFGPFEFRLVGSDEPLDRVVGPGRVGRDLFPLAILLVALALALEHVVANRFYREA